MGTLIKTSVEKIGDDLKEYIATSINGIADSHLEVWKERYASYKGNKRRVEEDVCINHDPSLEVERVEEELERKLTIEEWDFFVEEFEKAVVSQWGK